MPKKARLIPKVNVSSRHRPECKHAGETSYIRCRCPKQLWWSQNGKLHRVAAETDNCEIAEKKAHDKTAEFQRMASGEPAPAPLPSELPTIAEVVALFLKTKKQLGYTPKSIRRLEYWFNKRFLGFCTDHGLLRLADVTLLHLEAWRSTWEGIPASKQKAQSRVRGFFDWALRRDLISKNPALGLDDIKVKNGDSEPTVALDDEQFAQVLAAIPRVNGETDDATRRELRALVLFQRWSGLALGDVLKRERSGLKPDPDGDGWYQLFLRRAKTGTEVFCSIPPTVGSELLALDNGNDRYFFWDGVQDMEKLKNRWHKLYKKLSIAAQVKDEHGELINVRSHVLRDTFAISLFNSDFATEDVAQLLGHESITVTMKHYSPWIRSRQKRLTARIKQAYAARWTPIEIPCGRP